MIGSAQTRRGGGAAATGLRAAAMPTWTAGRGPSASPATRPRAEGANSPDAAHGRASTISRPRRSTFEPWPRALIAGLAEALGVALVPGDAHPGETSAGRWARKVPDRRLDSFAVRCVSGQLAARLTTEQLKLIRLDRYTWRIDATCIEYDIAVIGGGPGGYVAALYAGMRGAQRGAYREGPAAGRHLPAARLHPVEDDGQDRRDPRRDAPRRRVRHHRPRRAELGRHRRAQGQGGGRADAGASTTWSRRARSPGCTARARLLTPGSILVQGIDEYSGAGAHRARQEHHHRHRLGHHPGQRRARRRLAARDHQRRDSRHAT